MGALQNFPLAEGRAPLSGRVYAQVLTRQVEQFRRCSLSVGGVEERLFGYALGRS